MRSKATLFGHSIHQMLIVFPLGLLASSLLFDILRGITGAGIWSEAAYWMIAVGIISGLVAALFGMIDWTGIPAGTRAKRVGAVHGLGNVVVVVLFFVSWLLRGPDPATPAAVAIIFSVAGVGLALVTGWLGGELVTRLGVGVDEGAHVNATSSLTGQPASEGVRRREV